MWMAHWTQGLVEIGWREQIGCPHLHSCEIGQSSWGGSCSGRG